MKQHLVFDTTDAQSILDSDNIGVYVRAGTDGTQIGHVSDALKVNLSNASIAVTATDLDIRDLVFATDKVDVSGSTVELGATTLAALETIELGATTLAALENITVSATDLDIRDLSHSQDSIKIGDGTDFLAINADGSINVNADISVSSGSDKAEDAAHASGDIGTYILGVRQDTLSSSTSADGDYASLKVNSLGRLYVDVGTVTVNDVTLANTAIATAANPLAVAGTSEDVVASPLSNRKYLYIYNNDNTAVFIGTSGVSAATGYPLFPGSQLELRAGAAVDIEFVGQTGKTPEIRTLELS